MLSLNPSAIHLLEKNPDKINWFYLSRNPSAIPLLEQNPEKINWDYFSLNHSICDFGYIRNIKHYFKHYLTEDLIKTVMHPRNYNRLWFIDEDDE